MSSQETVIFHLKKKKKKRKNRKKAHFITPALPAQTQTTGPPPKSHSQSPEGRPGLPLARLSTQLGGVQGLRAHGEPHRMRQGPWGEADPESLITELQQELTAARGSPAAPPGTPSPCENETRPGPRPWHPVGAQCTLSPNGMVRLVRSSKHTLPGSNRPQRTGRTRSLLRTSPSPPRQAEVSAGSSFQFPFHYCLLSSVMDQTHDRDTGNSTFILQMGNLRLGKVTCPSYTTSER